MGGRSRIRYICAAAVGLALTSVVACNPAPTLSTRSVEQELGLSLSTKTQGDNCFADFDGDRRPDVALLNHGVFETSVMRDPGAGPFATRATFPKYDDHHCATADFNRDGRTDLYLGAGGCGGTCPSGYPKRLYLQTPDGTFTERAADWGVAEATGRGRDSAAFDANNDGFPDLFTGNEPRTATAPVNQPSPNRFFRNVAGTKMVDATTEFGLPLDAELGGACVTPADINGDGFVDVVVCGETRTLVYRNVGGTRFVEDTTLGIPATRVLADARFADLDRDGDLDFLSITYGNVYVRLNAGGRFPTDDYRLPLGGGGSDLAVGDVDGDGDEDFYATVALGGQPTNKPDLLMLNGGDGRTFTQLTTPQVTEGSGDTAEILPNWRGRRGALIVVNNGNDQTGPRQAIEVVRG